jgi:hypothetical protein
MEAPRDLAPEGEVAVSRFCLTHLSDEAIDRHFHASVQHHDVGTAEMLAGLAEFDERRRYLPAGYESMWDYCRQKLEWSPDVTKQRIQAARKAREFPQIFPLLASGRLDLSGIRLLAPHLTQENAAELLARAADRSRGEIKHGLRERFTTTMASDGKAGISQQNAGAPEHLEPDAHRTTSFQLESPEPVPAQPVRPADEISLHLSIDREMELEMRYAQALLSHKSEYRDTAKLIQRAMKALTKELETKRFGSAVARRRLANGRVNPRYIPADIRRAVLARDGFGCRHVGTDGHVCGSTHNIQFDHRVPLAQGGLSTVDNLEIVCAAHNQFRAEQRLGKDRVAAGRERTERQRAEKRAREAKRSAPPPALTNEREAERRLDVEAALRALGVRVADAKRIAGEVCAALPEATLERTVFAACQRLGAPVRAA